METRQPQCSLRTPNPVRSPDQQRDRDNGPTHFDAGQSAFRDRLSDRVYHAAPLAASGNSASMASAMWPSIASTMDSHELRCRHVPGLA